MEKRVYFCFRKPRLQSRRRGRVLKKSGAMSELISGLKGSMELIFVRIERSRKLLLNFLWKWEVSGNDVFLKWAFCKWDLECGHTRIFNQCKWPWVHTVIPTWFTLLSSSYACSIILECPPTLFDIGIVDWERPDHGLTMYITLFWTIGFYW